MWDANQDWQSSPSYIISSRSNGDLSKSSVRAEKPYIYIILFLAV